MSEAQSVRAHHPHAVGAHISQALPKALQAGDRSSGDLFIDPAILLDARRETHHLAQAVNDDQLTVGIPRHDHVKAVRPEVYGREYVGDVAR